MQSASRASVMVLAAGFGSRLRPLTDECPKPLVPVGDRPLLEHLFERLAASGHSRAVINTHHLPDHFAHLDTRGVLVQVSHEPRILGSAGGVKQARALLGSPIVVCNGDIWGASPSAQLLDGLVDAAVCLQVAPARAPSTSEPARGTVGVDRDGCVVRLRDQRFGDEHRGVDYVGILALAEPAIARLPDEGCLIGDVCLPLLARGERIRTCLAPTEWYDVGSLAGYLGANRAWLGLQGAPFWIGEGAQVPPEVTLRDSVIGRGVVVEGSGVVERSVVWPGARAQAPLTSSVVTRRGLVVRAGEQSGSVVDGAGPDGAGAA